MTNTNAIRPVSGGGSRAFSRFLSACSWSLFFRWARTLSCTRRESIRRGFNRWRKDYGFWRLLTVSSMELSAGILLPGWRPIVPWRTRSRLAWLANF